MKKQITSLSVLQTCEPRAEVLQGELDDAIFAADFGQLLEGSAPRVYSHAETFFRNTEPTPDLKAICMTVFKALSDRRGSGQLIRLSTGFGGGKTHTLIALWHLANNIQNVSAGSELLSAADRPKTVKVVAIDLAKAGVPVFANHRNLQTRSLQGEFFYQLGGPAGLKALGGADHPEACPDEATIARALPSEPLLVLLDELVIYMASLSATGQGNLLSFLSKLISAVSKRRQAVLVVTDPGQQTAYAGVSQQLSMAIGEASVKLEDILGRKMTDFDPVGKQAARVIARRLFDKIDPAAAAKTSANYHQLYERVHEAHPDILPDSAVSTEYAKRIEQCYPFHPRLIDTAKERLGPLPEFQRSRGVLRLFARLIRDIWTSGHSVELITAGDINWSNQTLRADLLQRLRREAFGAAVEADIEGHAFELDDRRPGGIHVRVASALLLESLPCTEHSGLDPAELTLAVLRTNEAGPEPSEALDRLIGACWHTYPISGGRGWQFRFEPNVIKQIEQYAAKVDLLEARERVLSEAQAYFGGPRLSLSSWPETPRDVLERKELQVALCETVELAKEVCTWSDTRNPSAPVPRRFRNAIVAIAPQPDAFNNAIERAKRLIAAEQIEREARHSQSAALVRDQLQRIKPRLVREFRIQTSRAFDTLVRSEGVICQIEEEYQVPDEEVLRQPQGQRVLMRFLESKGLIYKTGDSLDPDLFLKVILGGTTPIPDQPDVHRLSDVHERFLSAQGLRLVPDPSIVRQTVLRALEAGKVVVRLPDGTAYDKTGAVTGSEGQRRTEPGVKPSLHLIDNELITRADSASAKAWLKVDTQVIKENKSAEIRDRSLPPGVAEPEILTATNWQDALRLAENCLLKEVRLEAATPAAAANLVGMAQPLGADELCLDVNVQGDLKSGGTAAFEVREVKLNCPIKPLETARALFSGMREGMSYVASLTLRFHDPGRIGMKEQLESIADKASADLNITATFGKPVTPSKSHS